MRNKGWLAAASLLFLGHSHAHEVHGSNVTVTVKQNKVEVLQSTSVFDAKQISQALGGKTKTHEDILATIGAGWQVIAKQENCLISKQAYRLVHQNSQLQMRYLFECNQGQSPDILALPWLMKAPNDHFIIFNLKMDVKSKTTIFQKQNLVIELDTAF